MEKIEIKNLKETLYFKKLDNGLRVYVLPKSGFNKTYATFTTKYGSIDSVFGLDELKKVPDGIAHFLEHKMFETADGGDVFNDFTRNGANSNAFTSFTRTSYLFSSTNNVEKNLSTLLDFVQELTITEESVEKEKGIIIQEIKMYEDNADWRSYFGTIENMFKKHPVRIDIAGSVESVSSITVEDLKYCYNTFYHPSNMLLFIVGNVVPEDILKLVEANQNTKKYEAPREILREVVTEGIEVFKHEDEIMLDVSNPKVMIGFKEDMNTRQSDVLKYELALGILVDLLIGSSSEKYEELTKKGIIDPSFSTEVSIDETFGFIMMGGDTKKPEELKKEILTMFKNLDKVKIDKKDFERYKKKLIGQMISSFNSLEFIANSFTKYQFEGKNLFDIIPTLENITYADVEGLKAFFKEEGTTVLNIVPNKKG